MNIINALTNEIMNLLIMVYGYVLVSCIFNPTDLTWGSVVYLTYVIMFSINQYHQIFFILSDFFYTLTNERARQIIYCP